MDHLLSGQNQLDTSIHRYLKARSFGRAARTLLSSLLSCKTASRCSSRQMHVENLRKITVQGNHQKALEKGRQKESIRLPL
jgi:hypothetical protein